MATWKKIALETTAVSFSGLTLTGLLSQTGETTALMINGSNVVGTRDLGSNAFTDTSIPTTLNDLTDVSAGSPAGGNFIVYNGTDSFDAISMSGDVTMSETGATTIGNDKVTTAKIAGANVTNAKLASNAVQNNVIDNGAISGIKITDDTIAESKLDIHNAPVDSYILTYDSVNGMTWSSPAAASSDVDVSVSNLETRLGQIDSNITIGNSDTVQVTIAGNLVVSGTTTTVNSTELTVADKIITVAEGGANAATVGTAGMEVDVSNATQNPFIGFADGTQLGEFVVKKEGSGTAYPISLMQFSTSAPTGSDNSAGVGALHFNTSTGALYVRSL